MREVIIIKDVDLAIVNALRRVILSEIPTLAFYFDASDVSRTDIKIKKNTGALHNEFLAHRISLIPLHFTQQEIDTFESDVYDFRIKKKNTTSEILAVTSEDFEIFKDGKPLSKKEKSRIFPKNPITGDYVLITKLRPNTCNITEGEEIDVECKASRNTALLHSRWSPVSQCSFINKVDNEAAKIAFADKIKKLQQNGKVLSSSEIEEMKKQFNTLEAYRYFIKNKYDEPCEFEFTIESECALKPKELFTQAFDILSKKVEYFVKSINEGNGEVTIRNVASIQNFFEIEIKNETYTLLNVLQSLIYNNNIRGKSHSTLEFIGYYNPHPLDNKMILKVKFSNELKGIDDKFLIKFMVDNCKVIKDHISTLREETENSSVTL